MSQINYISQDAIKLECNIKIKRILQLSVQESTGQHAYAEITADIEAGSVEPDHMQLSGEPFMLFYMEGREKVLLFSGMLEQAALERMADYDILHLRACSLTRMMDLEKKCRSFQDEKKTVRELIEQTAKENMFSVICSLADRKAAGPFIQYKETDWAFFLRMCSHLGLPVFAAPDYDGRGIYVGFRESGEPLILTGDREEWHMDAGDMMPQKRKKTDCCYYKIVTGQMVHAGQKVIYQGQTLWIHNVNIFMEHGCLMTVCKLAEKSYATITPVWNPQLKGLSLTGTVLARKNERIRLHLDIDEEQDKEKAFFYPWIPDYGDLVYCMPEEGTKVRLVISGEDERKAVAINCVRGNDETCEGIQIPTVRHFVTEHDKRMMFGPASLELSADSGQSVITMTDEAGNMIKSSGDIQIQASGNVYLQGTRVDMNASAEVTAVKRQPGDPVVVNLCHNLDSIGAHTVFENVDRLRKKKGTRAVASGQNIYTMTKENTKQNEVQKEKLRFRLKELTERDMENGTYDLGSSLINVISAIPQYMEEDYLVRIAAGCRPISGRMKGERTWHIR